MKRLIFVGKAGVCPILRINKKGNLDFLRNLALRLLTPNNTLYVFIVGPDLIGKEAKKRKKRKTECDTSSLGNAFLIQFNWFKWWKPTEFTQSKTIHLRVEQKWPSVGRKKKKRKWKHPSLSLPHLSRDFHPGRQVREKAAFTHGSPPPAATLLATEKCSPSLFTRKSDVLSKKERRECCSSTGENKCPKQLRRKKVRVVLILLAKAFAHEENSQKIEIQLPQIGWLKNAIDDKSAEKLIIISCEKELWSLFCTCEHNNDDTSSWNEMQRKSKLLFVWITKSAREKSRNASWCCNQIGKFAPEDGWLRIANAFCNYTTKSSLSRV